MLILLADRIRKYGFEPVIVTLQAKGVFHKMLSLFQLRYYTLNFKKNPFGGLLKFFYIFLKEKPCLLHSFLFAGNMFAKFIRIFFWTPLICSQRSTDNWKRSIHWKMEKFSDFLCSLVVSNSKAGKKALVENAGIKPNKILVIPNGIDLEIKRKKLANDKQIQKHKGITVGAVGNLREAKGFDILIKAANIVSNKRNDIRFVILGKGPLEKNLTSLIEKLGLSETVLLYGFVENVYNYMANFDIVVISSRWEGFPVVALEAMACGKPVVATKVGDLPEIIEHGVNGLIVEPERPEELADAILTIASDEKMRELMGKNSIEIVKKFSLEDMVEKYCKIYEMILKNETIQA
ncbi:MAG: glycosyltransferase [Candidatus Omnitrophica bacterium]|nr:glycosyltransferase [Candidatus Omnitrophota bacterium]